MVAISDGLDRAGAPSRAPLNGAFSTRDLLIHVFYNMKIIRLCLLAGLILGVAAALLSRTEYTAESLLLIRTDASDTAQQGIAGPAPALTGDAVKRILQSDIQIMESEPVVRAAVTRVQAESKPKPSLLRGLLGGGPAAGAQDPAAISKAMEAFRRHLHVAAEPDSNIIHVSYKSSDRDLAIRSVQALVDAYSDRRASMYVSGSGALQQQSLKQYQQDIQGIEGQIQQVRAEYGVLDIVQDIALAGTRLDNIDLRTSQARERLSAVNAELGATTAGLRRSPSQVFESREASNASPNDDTRNTLVKLRQEREHVAAQYTAAWPGLQELDRKIAAAQAALAANALQQSQTEKVVRNPVLDTLNTRFASLDIEKQALTRQLAELAQQRTEAQARVDRLRQADEQLRDLQRTRDVMEGIYKQLSVSQAGTQLHNDAVDDRNTTLRVVQPATAPEKGRSMTATWLLAGLLFGVISAVVMSGLATLLRQVFITPGEAERALRLPIVADFDERSSDFRSPEGRLAVDQLATFLMDQHPKGRSMKTVQILSSGDEGRSDLGLAIGHALAVNHGQRTLVIDFDKEKDFRVRAATAAAIEKIPAGGFEVGVARTKAENLWVSVDAGATPLRAAKTSLAEVRRGMAGLEEGFDRIILVSNRNHAGYAARRLYPLADANLVVVRSEKTRAPVIRQLVETVLDSGGDMLGVVYTGRRYYVPEFMYQWL